jgi:hypothetical protein
MRILQDAIDGVLQDLPEQALSALIEKKLAEQGVRLSARQRKLLTRSIVQGDTETVQLWNWNWNWWDHRHVTLEFTSEDAEQIEKNFTEFADERLPELIQSVIDDLARDILADLKRRWPTESRQQRRDLIGFRKRLYDRWKAPLESLRMMVTMSRELGDSVNRELRQSPDASSRRHVVDVLARSHARACQIVEEILTLLEAGFADGAMARWRTMHEIAVVASFIAAHGEEAAERYVSHEAIESKRAADDYQRCQPRLGYEPLPDKEIKAAQKAYEAVIAKYGPEFAKGDYGWAPSPRQAQNPDVQGYRGRCTDRSFPRALPASQPQRARQSERRVFQAGNSGGVASAARRSQQRRARRSRPWGRTLAVARHSGACGAAAAAYA